MIHTGNYALTDPTCEDGDMFENANIMQAVADTEICVGKTNITFHSCNLINCKIPDGLPIISSNTCKKDFCVHNHPNFGLPAEPEECRHWIGADINADGDIVNEYEDITL